VYNTEIQHKKAGGKEAFLSGGRGGYKKISEKK